MPAPVISGIINRLTDTTNAVYWDGEVPRQNVDGTDVIIDLPSDLVFKVSMSEGGLQREWTTENAYGDTGPIDISLWATQRSTVEDALTVIEEILAKEWDEIDLGVGFQVYEMLMLNWYSGQEEGIRSRKSPLLYRGSLTYNIGVHGSVETRRETWQSQ